LAGSASRAAVGSPRQKRRLKEPATIIGVVADAMMTRAIIDAVLYGILY